MQRRLTPVDDMTKAVHSFLYNRDEEARAKRLKDHSRNVIKDWLLAKAGDKFINGRADENGHRYRDFDMPVTIGDATYTGIRATRKLSSYVDEERAEELLRSKGEENFEYVFPVVEERRFDEDRLFALNQRGLISDEELDSLVVEDESFSIVPVKE